MTLEVEKNDLILDGSNDCSSDMNLIDLDIGECESIYASSSNLSSTCLSDKDKELHDFLEFRYQNNMDDIEFQVGRKFSTKEVLKEAIKEHAMKCLYNVKMVNNDTRRIRDANGNYMHL